MRITATDFNSRKVVTMQEFLKMDMKGKIIKNVILPPLNDKHKIVTFKVSLKHFQNIIHICFKWVSFFIYVLVNYYNQYI